jgi:hypothetical protein
LPLNRAVDATPALIKLPEGCVTEELGSSCPRVERHRSARRALREGYDCRSPARPRRGPPRADALGERLGVSRGALRLDSSTAAGPCSASMSRRCERTLRPRAPPPYRRWRPRKALPQRVRRCEPPREPSFAPRPRGPGHPFAFARLRIAVSLRPCWRPIHYDQRTRRWRGPRSGAEAGVSERGRGQGNHRKGRQDRACGRRTPFHIAKSPPSPSDQACMVGGFHDAEAHGTQRSELMLRSLGHS